MIAARNSRSFEPMGTKSQVHGYCWEMVPCMATSVDIAVQGRGVGKLNYSQGGEEPRLQMNAPTA
jgi:hypothetical protein